MYRSMRVGKYLNRRKKIKILDITLTLGYPGSSISISKCVVNSAVVISYNKVYQDVTYPQENTSSVLFQLTQITTPTCLGSLKFDVFSFIINYAEYGCFNVCL